MRPLQMLLEWVLTSAFLIVVVAVLRTALGKRVGAELRYALWAVVLVRLLVPVQLFPIPIPAVALPEPGLAAVTAPPAPSSVPALPVGGPALAAPAPDGVVVDYAPISQPTLPKTGPLPVLQVLGWLWLAGSLVMVTAFLVSNASFARRLRRVRVPLEGADCPLPVYMALNLPSPCLFGLARPAVYITPETAADPDMLRHVLAHEYAHYRQADHIWNVLRSLALAVHWWNPLVWLAVSLSRRDCELACDERALRRLGEGERIAYGRTLLALLTEKPGPGDLLRCATTMTGDQKSVWERVTRIAHAPRRWLWAAVAVVLITAVACVCAFGSAAEPKEAPGFDLDGITADLSFSLDQSDSGSFVRIDGAVDDMELTRGALWYPEAAWKEDADGELMMVYPAFTEGIEGCVMAWWADEGRTSVTISTKPTVLLSSYLPSGWWEFTVDLSNGGSVTEMASYPMMADGDLAGATRFYPSLIQDEEAVRAARVAAKLLTAGEDYFWNSIPERVEDRITETLYAPWLSRVDENEMLLTYQGKQVRFTEQWEDWHQPAGEAVQVIDLDGDGRDEIVLILTYSHGTGTLVQRLHVFDAVTLSEYSCSGLAEGLVERIISTGDDQYFYLSASAGDMEWVAIPKSAAQRGAADYIEFGSMVEYRVEDGRLYCVLGCDMGSLEYCGEIWIGLSLSHLSPAAGIEPVSFEYVSLIDLPVGSPVALAARQYQAVLLGEEEFTLVQNGQVTITRKYLAGFTTVEQFALVKPTVSETVVVLKTAAANGAEGFMFLYEKDGTVYGVENYLGTGKSYARRCDLKTDGTLFVNPSPGRDGQVWAVDTEGYFRLDANRDEERAFLPEEFWVGGFPADEEEYRAALERAAAKPDAVWYDFTPENIDAVLGF